MAEPSLPEESIFAQALEIPSAAERVAFLDRACGGDAALRAEVEALLRADEARVGGDLLDWPDRCVATVDAPFGERAGVVIGPYRLMEEIGEGGMGLVFVAEQQQPVRRLVALKIIKPGMDTRHVVARFEAERQALALMDHPNIARVFDCGATELGRPYFVMELVKGVPITPFCDDNQFSVRRRLELFLDVCAAVQHAHQKGVIHRDLKPANILVTKHDATPVVKVIDFGVAKAVGQQLTEKTLYTQLSQMVGTPLYMSPEQAGQSGLDVDTRSDVYSLGVLLYELLTGQTPFEPDRLRAAGFDELRRIIREEEPPRPSNRLSTLGHAAVTVSVNRRIEPRKLSRLMQGELDWVVMKALEKDRNRRYETANGFALDVQRYLADEPVLARPPSVGYRLRKFARRNRRGLTVTVAIALGSLVGIGGICWAAQDRAAMRAKEAHDLDRALDRAESFENQGKRADALAALDRAEVLAGELPQTPARTARLTALRDRLDAEGRDLAFVAEFEAIRLRVANLEDVGRGRFHHEGVLPELRESLSRYGIPLGKVVPAEAAAYIQSRPVPVRQNLIAALDECLRLSTPGDVPTRQWLLSVLAVADNDVWRARVRQAEADQDWVALEPLVRATDERSQSPSYLLGVANGLPEQLRATQLNLLRRTQRAYPADVWANHWLAFALCTRHDQAAEAIRYFTAAVALRPNSPGHYVNRGSAFLAVKEWDSAIADFQQALFLAPRYGKAHFNLGLALDRKGRLDDAIVEYREAIKLDNEDDRAHYNLGLVLNRKGRLDEAISEFREAIRADKGKAVAYCELGRSLRRRGEFREALEALRRGHELGSKDPRWRYASAQWVRQCERLVELDQLLPNLLLGKATTTSPVELIELARLCSLKSLHREAARFYERAFAARPELAEDLRFGYRHEAARAASLAGSGQGKDAEGLDSEERSRLRGQALIWLRADLAAWRRVPDKEPARSVAAKRAIAQLRLCTDCPDFKGVRGAEALSKLPEKERQPWQQIWGEVAGTLAQFQSGAAPMK